MPVQNFLLPGYSWPYWDTAVLPTLVYRAVASTTLDADLMFSSFIVARAPVVSNVQ
jgi:hypothetical protein